MSTLQDFPGDIENRISTKKARREAQATGPAFDRLWIRGRWVTRSPVLVWVLPKQALVMFGRQVVLWGKGWGPHREAIEKQDRSEKVSRSALIWRK